MKKFILQTKSETPYLRGIAPGTRFRAESQEMAGGTHEVSLVPVEGFALRILYLDETEFHSIFSILKKN